MRHKVLDVDNIVKNLYLMKCFNSNDFIQKISVFLDGKNLMLQGTRSCSECSPNKNHQFAKQNRSNDIQKVISITEIKSTFTSQEHCYAVRRKSQTKSRHSYRYRTNLRKQGSGRQEKMLVNIWVPEYE